MRTTLNIDDDLFRKARKRPLEMMSSASTDDAPWTLVAANDKRQVRITALRTLCDRLEDTLNRA